MHFTMSTACQPFATSLHTYLHLIVGKPIIPASLLNVDQKMCASLGLLGIGCVAEVASP